jgi:hypothetical protein
MNWKAESTTRKSPTTTAMTHPESLSPNTNRTTIITCNMNRLKKRRRKRC